MPEAWHWRLQLDDSFLDVIRLKVNKLVFAQKILVPPNMNIHAVPIDLHKVQMYSFQIPHIFQQWYAYNKTGIYESLFMNLNHLTALVLRCSFLTCITYMYAKNYTVVLIWIVKNSIRNIILHIINGVGIVKIIFYLNKK